MVGVQGFEPWTPCSQSRCATRLRYTPTESIFYTETAIAGKSCKISAMVAYFSSKFTNKLKIAFTVVSLVFCLLGTHAIGFSHSISHAHPQSQTDLASISSESLPSLSHSSDACHLFDALTLAGFIAVDSVVVTYDSFAQQSSHAKLASHAQATFDHYQSRAPPTFHL